MPILLSFYLMLLSMTCFFTSIMFMFKKIKILLNWTLIKMLSFKIEFIMYLDWLNLTFFSVVMLISSMVLIYSMEYMNNHPYIKRFMLLIIIFFISMIMMILSPNMLSILLGWDGLGLSSFCLIIFYQNQKSFNSGMTTLLMNRIGDINIIIMISILINKNNWNFMYLNKINMLIMLLVLFAAITKSAQIPFSTWLPLAMAAPTPVSSLVHSSTLVTAGVYLMIRFNYMFNEKFMYMLMLISTTTMMLASSSAMFEFDLKKIIALSTLSQLGLMFLSISMNLPMLAFFHLITHAMFKSLLFLCSGIIIHSYYNHQDIRFISTTNMISPMTTLIFNTSSLTLCGMPFLSGFYSKDLMIEMFNMKIMNYTFYNLMYLSMMMTVIYSFRLIFYVSIKPLKLSISNKFKMKNMMNYSLYILFLMSILYGSSINWLMFSSMNIVILNIKTKLMIYQLLIKMIILTLILPTMTSYINKYKSMIYNFISQMWLITSILKKNKINMFIMNNKLNSIKDTGWLEYLTPLKMYFFLKKLNKIKKINKLNFTLIMLQFTYLLMYIILFN